MAALVSVIVPVYEVENYLERCIQSLLTQTYVDLEIILVNDGSLDRSGDICDNAAHSDSRVRVIHKPNSGAGAARNVGLDVALGKYVMFVDADDWVHHEIVSHVMTVLLESGADVAGCRLRHTGGDIESTTETIGVIDTMDARDALARYCGPLSAWMTLRESVSVVPVGGGEIPKRTPP